MIFDFFRQTEDSSYNASPFFLRPFWFAAGGDPYLLRQGTYSDQIKIACLGGTVYATAVLALFSFTYAMHTVFSKNIDQDIKIHFWLMGAVWSIIIFNLDRFIVSSAPPNTQNKGFFKQLLSAPFLTRLGMGTIMGFVIATPLKIKVFEKDIQKIVLEKKEESMNLLVTSKEVKFGGELERIATNISELDKELALLEYKRDRNQIKMEDELEGVYSGVKGYGKNAKKYENERNKFEKEIEAVKIKREKERENLSGLQEKIKELSPDEINKIESGLNSLVFKAMLPYEINSGVAWFIVAFFLSIELAPIFLKTFMEASPYDYQKEDRDDLIKRKSKELSTSALDRIKRKVGIENSIHEDSLQQQKSEADDKLELRRASFERAKYNYSLNLNQYVEAEQEWELQGRFNAQYNDEIEKRYLQNLKKRKDYLTELSELKIEQSQKDAYLSNEMEKILLWKQNEQQIRGMIFEVEKLKLQKIKEQEIKEHEQQKSPSNSYHKMKNSKIQFIPKVPMMRE